MSQFVVHSSGFTVHSPMSEVRCREERGGGSFRGRRHLACVWPGCRRRSEAQAGLARIGKLQRLSVRNVAFAHQVLGEFGAAEEGPSELLAGGRRSAIIGVCKLTGGVGYARLEERTKAASKTSGATGTAAWAVGTAEADHDLLECPFGQKTDSGSHHRWAGPGRLP